MNMLQKRREIATFTKLRRAVQEMCRRYACVCVCAIGTNTNAFLLQNEHLLIESPYSELGESVCVKAGV